MLALDCHDIEHDNYWYTVLEGLVIAFGTGYSWYGQNWSERVCTPSLRPVPALL